MRTNPNRLAILILLIGLIVVPTLAATITFEESIPEPQTIRSQYCNNPVTNLGVEFLDIGRIIEPSVATASPTHAFTNAFIGSEFGEFRKIHIRFTTPQSHVSVKAGLNPSYPRQVTAYLKAYDSPTPDDYAGAITWAELGSGPSPITTELSVSSSIPRIRSIEIEFLDSQNMPAYEFIDDLTFDSIGPLCTSDTGAPTVVISTPTTGQIVQNPYGLELAYTATDTGTGVARVQVAALNEAGSVLRSFDACGGPNTQPCMYLVVPTTVHSDYLTYIPEDARSIQVTAWDFAGNSGKASTSFSVDPIGYPNLWIEALEITQATQPWLPVNSQPRSTVIPTFNYVALSTYSASPLVAKKTTVVRVYPHLEGTLNNLPVNGVRAELRCFVDSGYTTPCAGVSMILPQNQPPSILKEVTVHPGDTLDTRERDTRLSWNFLLPEAWTNEGTIYLEARGKMAPGMKECEGCEDGANAIRVSYITFQKVPAFDTLIHVLKTSRTLDGSQTFAPTQTQISQLLQNDVTMMPIDEATVPTTFTSWSYSDSSSTVLKDRCNGIFNELKKVSNTGKWKVIYALVDDQFPCSGAGWGGYAFGRAGGMGIVAHESGHGVNINHPGPAPGHGSPPCPPPGGGNCAECNPASWCDTDWPWPHGTIGAFGFNTQDMKVITPDSVVEATSAHDFMSYGPNEWASPRNWIRMFNGFTGQNVPWPVKALSASRNLAPSGSSSSYLIVGGNQRDDGTWVLQPAYEIGLPSDTVPQESSGEYRIVSRDSAGKELGTRLFSIPLNHIDMGDRASGMTALPASPSFVEVIPRPEAIEKMELQQNGGVLAALLRSPNVPSIQILSPSASGFGSPPQIEWTATDLDGDSLRFMVQYSTDPTTDEWETLAVDLTANQLPVDLTGLPGSDNARVRVLTTDGLNTGVAISSLFSVGDKPPQASILSPTSGTIMEEHDRLVLVGSASDLEDGVLEGNSLTWSSDRDGALGTGNRLDVTTLTPGNHKITFTVQDSHGQVGTTSITVSVVTPLNRQPVADAGLDATVTVGILIQLDGRESFDDDGDPLSYSWSIIEGPSFSNPLLTGAKMAQPTFSADIAGDYTIELIVDDGMVASIPDLVQIQVTGNSPPFANAGRDQQVPAGEDCQAKVVLDGAGSSDPDGDTLSYRWTNSFGAVSGSTPTIALPLGEHTITLTVDDREGGSESDLVNITVIDSSPPAIQSLTATPNVLWPANHKMTQVKIIVATTDNCDTKPLCKISSVKSNEPENGLGDGDAAPDWSITGNSILELRAERSGSGTGRNYTVSIECADAAGNLGTKDVIVTVPHDLGKNQRK